MQRRPSRSRRWRRCVRELEAASAHERGRAEREDFLRWQLREIDELDAARRRGGRARARARSPAPRRDARRPPPGARPSGSTKGRRRSATSSRASARSSIRPRPSTGRSLPLRPRRRVRARGAGGRGAGAGALRRGGRGEPGAAGRGRGARVSLAEALAQARARRPRSSWRTGRRWPRELDVAGERVGAAGDARGGEGRDASPRRRPRRARSRASGATPPRSSPTPSARELAQLGMGRARVVVDVTPAAARGRRAARRRGAPDAHRDRPRRVSHRAEPRARSRDRCAGSRAAASCRARSSRSSACWPTRARSGTYVFDEVDAGVGGAVAEVIGRAIADIARHRQVVCITHLPQIAALADAHFVVDKTESNGQDAARASAACRRPSASRRSRG